MERVVRKFALRVIAVHASLLLLLLVIVGLASRTIYRSARGQALEQAKQHQALLTAQTARGIEGFYGSVLDALDLMSVAENEDAPGSRQAPGLIGPRGVVFARLIDRQLKERVSQVFLLDRGTMTAFAVGGADPDLPPGEVVAQFGDWFRTVEGPRISPFKRHERAGGYNVVAVPARRDARLMLVATVPVLAMENQLLDRLGRGETVAMLLVDDAGVVMAGKKGAWVGQDLNALGGPFAGRTLHELRLVNFRATRVMSEPFKLGDDTIPPSMFATEPVEVAGRTWFLLIASHLEEVDAAVTGLVRNGAPWVVFVVLAMTGLLASTSVQLIRNRVRLERERTRALEADIANARQIQLAWLPDGGAVHDGLDVAAVNLPAAHVSGDFYNWFALPNGRAAVVIGDVTGHGMSAAFLMATVQLMVRNTLPIVGDPGRCLEEVNNQLCVQMFHGQFVTIQVLVIDPANTRLDIANAGHPPPLTCDGDAGAFSPLKVEPQLVLGIQPDVPYPTQRFDIAPCCGILLYTDGVLDAVAEDGTRFDAERLAASVSGRCASAEALVGTVVDALNAFRGERELVDDLTVVAVQLQPAGVAKPQAAAMA